MGCRRKEKWSERENKTTKQDDEAGSQVPGGGEVPRGRKTKKKKKKEVQVEVGPYPQRMVRFLSGCRCRGQGGER